MNGALDISLQQVNYHGWNISPSFTNFLYDSAITPFSTSSSHMYTQDQESNTRAQGFRLQAVYRTETNSLKITNLSRTILFNLLIQMVVAKDIKYNIIL